MTNTPTPLLDCRKLQISVAGRHLVDGLDLPLNRGQFVAVLGKNGSGKTLTLKTMAGLRSCAQSWSTRRSTALRSTWRRAAARAHCDRSSRFQISRKSLWTAHLPTGRSRQGRQAPCLVTGSRADDPAGIAGGESLRQNAGGTGALGFDAVCIQGTRGQAAALQPPTRNDAPALAQLRTDRRRLARYAMLSVPS